MGGDGALAKSPTRRQIEQVSSSISVSRQEPVLSRLRVVPLDPKVNDGFAARITMLDEAGRTVILSLDAQELDARERARRGSQGKEARERRTQQCCVCITSAKKSPGPE